MLPLSKNKPNCVRLLKSILSLAHMSLTLLVDGTCLENHCKFTDTAVHRLSNARHRWHCNTARSLSAPGGHCTKFS